MENKSQFNNKEILDFAKFWEGDIGKKYLAKLEKSRDDWLLAATQQPSQELTFKVVNIALGIANVIADINGALEEAKKIKEAAGNTKK